MPRYNAGLPIDQSPTSQELLAFGVKVLPPTATGRQDLWEYFFAKIIPPEIAAERKRRFEETQKKFSGKRVRRIGEAGCSGIADYIIPARLYRQPNGTSIFKDYEILVKWDLKKANLQNCGSLEVVEFLPSNGHP